MLLIVATCCNKNVSKETIKELRTALKIPISAGNGLFLAGQAEGKTLGIIFHIFIKKNNRQVCALVPVTNCYDVPKEVCNNDPITTCNDVPKQNCNDVEENVCVDVVTNNCEQIETSCQFVKR